MRYRTRSDNNQKAIDAALRGVGASVVATGDVGKGFPDRVVGFRGETYLIETKNREWEKSESIAHRANHMRTEAQTTFHEVWKGKPIAIAYTPEEALTVIGASQKSSRFTGD